MKLSSIASITAVVAGLLGVGMGGYNLISTGCPLGTCDAPVATTTVSAEQEHNCALGCGHESHASSEVVAAGVVAEKDANGCYSNTKLCSEAEVMAAGSVSEKKDCDTTKCEKTTCEKGETCCKKGEKEEAPKDPA